MDFTLRDIGNSQGIIIPKTVLDLMHVQGKHLEAKIEGEKLILVAKKPAREGWSEAFAKALAEETPEQKAADWAEFKLWENATIADGLEDEEWDEDMFTAESVANAKIIDSDKLS